MKKVVRIIGILVLLFTLIFQIGASADSERIRSIDVDVVLDDDGTAKVTQVWDIYTSNGTEFFIPITHLNHMEIENFRVFDETGREFEFVENWDINGSLDDKAYKCGYNRIDDGVELCWGKGSYGDHKYTISWDYKNAVQSFTDYDGFNIRFINDQMKPTPESISISISKPGTPFTNENTRIWAFGYQGEILFQDDGVIRGKSNRSLYSNEYMNIMMSFEKGIFNPQVTNNNSFDTLKDIAMEGAKPYEEDVDSTGEKPGGAGISSPRNFRPSNVFPIIIGIQIFLVSILVATILNRKAFGNRIPYIKDGKKIFLYPKNLPSKPKNNDIDYYREPPFGEELHVLYYVRNLYDKNEPWADLVASYILRWIRSECIVPQEMTATKGLIFKKEVKKVNLVIVNTPDFESNSESEMWRFIRSAAGSDGILEEKEFQKYAEKNHTKIKKWRDNIAVEGGVEYLRLGGLEVVEASKNKANTNLTPNGEQGIRNYFGFKKFLSDFTIIAERGIKEVHLWDEYLINATAMGLGEEVSKQMESILPSYVFGKGEIRDNTISNYYTNYAIFNTVNSFAKHGSRGYATATSSSSGGGGSSFSGGGGGFSGGGSGGGSR